MFEECRDQIRGYHAVETCEKIGQIQAVLNMWQAHAGTMTSGTATPNDINSGENLLNVDPEIHVMRDYIAKQPTSIHDEYQVKEYQILGLNWLNSLFSHELSSILVDEMVSARPSRSSHASPTFRSARK
ncbi:hypothetical protein BKA62DRAFT_714607 [Auriculariales sp. MPI-PUGE-AT-0066]|nr:hypothetical protein BKA62DRAFT_714607 [Auriculariales sp. MPI-PUGE-AT-0066]